MMIRNKFLVLLLVAGIGCSSEPDEVQPGPGSTNAASVQPPPPAKIVRKVAPAAFAKDETELFLAIVADVSGSYQDTMIGENGLGFEFLGRLLKMFFRDRTGATDRMLLSQISATEKARIFDGAPRAFKRSFSSREEFRDFILKHSDPRSSRVLDSISDTLDRLNDAHAKNQGMKSSLIIMSDMRDNVSGPEGAKRLQECLMKYAQNGGVVGMYGVDDTIVSELEKILRACGFQDGQFIIESGIKVDPQLPSFDWAS